MARVKDYLGIIIVAVGVAAAGVATWYALHARPVAGAVIDTIPVDKDVRFVVRAEEGGNRSFLELHAGDRLEWQALIPHYAGAPGRPAVAWGPATCTVRVERDGHAEVFAFAMHDAAKIGGFKLAPEHEPIHTQPEGPITLSDHVRSYELVGGADWHQVMAVDLSTGNGVWKVDLGKDPITAGGVENGQLWLEQAGHRRRFDVTTGHELATN